MRSTPGTALLLGLLALASPAGAEVIEQAENGFLSRHVADVDTAPEALYAALVRKVGRWWDPQHTYSGDSGRLSIAARVGGCFCEKLDDGGAIEHMRVLYLQPGKLLRLGGGLGPLQEAGVVGTLTFTFRAVPASPSQAAHTQVEMRYSVGGFAAGGLRQWAGPVDEVLGIQFQRLLRYAASGDPGSTPAS